MILIALGANLPSSVGTPEETLRAALQALSARGVTCESVSGFFRSPAWPNPADPEFVNAIARVATRLSPYDLLQTLHDVEDVFGRRRGERNAPRTLDLDIIDYDGRVQPGPPELPHPRLQDRAFVLVPLSEVAPSWHHPVTGKSIAELTAAFKGADGVS